MFALVSKKVLAALLIAAGCCLLSADQPKVNIQFRNAFESPFEFSGIPWRGANGELRRLPPDITEKTVKPIMANFHSYHTSGGEVRFSTDSAVIAIRAEVYKNSDSPHMTRNAACGFALYQDAGGKYERLVRAFSPSTLEMRHNPERKPKRVNCTVKLKPGQGMRHFSLYLPLYSGVKKLEIGLADGAKLAPPAPRRVKLPIVFYGSSITQGCSAGHPGNNYTTMLCRAVGAPQINLGFSGAARGETRVAEAIAGLKMSALVIDYDHNAPDPNHLRKTHENFFKIIRKAQPALPIILVSGPREASPASRERRDIVKATYDRAAAAGDKHVYFVDGLSFFDKVPRKYCTVDNTHPSDLGFYLMFRKILPVLRQALGE